MAEPGISGRWRAAAAGVGGPDARTIGRRPADLTELPLSAPQERWWWAIRDDPSHPAYHLFTLSRLRGPLDADALARALGAVVDRHESLRATFGTRGGVPVQVIGPPAGLALNRLDTAGPDAEGRATALAREWADTRFDLAAGPSVRAYLLRLGDADHLLGVVLHHLLGDGLSLGILMREVWDHYRAFAAGTEPTPPTLDIGYGDWALWQWAQPELAEKNLRYWHDRLTDPPVLELPTDLPRPARKVGATAIVERRLDAGLAAGVDRLTRERRCTALTVLVAAYQALLCRHSGQDDVCVLSSLPGRDRVELEPLIGNFASFPVLRGDLSGDPPFGELLLRTRSAVLAAYAHPERPLRRLLAALDLPADDSRVPLYQTLFTLHPDGGPDGEVAPGLRAERFGDRYPEIFFDLTLDVWRDASGFSTLFRYDTALFAPATVEALARRYETLLRDAVARPDARLSELSILDDAERARLRELSTGPVRPDANARTVPDLVSALAVAQPDAVAVEWVAGTLSYADLWSAVEGLAGQLAAAGAGPGSVVAVDPDPGPDAVVAPLAVWRAGAACRWPDPGRVRRREERPFPARFVVTRAGGTPEWPGVTVIAPERAANRVAAATGPGLAAAASLPGPGDVAYRCGASGRTVDHGALANAVVALASWVDGGIDGYAGGRWLVADPGGLPVEALVPLATGGRLVLAGGGLASAAGGITHACATPTAWRVALDAGLDRPGLVAVVTGEPPPAALVGRLAARVGRVVVAHAPPGHPLWATVGDAGIGRPVANTRARVVDPHGREAPVGVPGELVLDGAGPTGERVRRLADGTLEYLGRLGDELTIRRCRVTPWEIEQRLAGHPAVTQAAVVADGEAFVACVVPATPGLDGDGLRRDLAATVPAPLVPEYVAIVPALPSTRDGRVDRAACAELAATVGDARRTVR